MRRLALLFLILSVFAPAAFAHWAVYPANITVPVGGMETAQPGWDHGLVMYEERDDFSSDDPDVAFVYGYVTKTGGSGGITVTGIHPGTAHVINTASHELLATITVYDRPLYASALPSERVTVTLGASQSLTVRTDGWTAAACDWYRGEVGDTTRPLPPSVGTESMSYRFQAVTVGTSRLWARVSGPQAVISVAFSVQVVAPPAPPPAPPARPRVAGH
jgi:hypothetical protein